jgi:hypothetical protein
MKVKLSLMGDMCMPMPLLLSAHEAWPCVESPTAVMWGPGFALQQNKLTRTVFHKGQVIALGGHDCGHWIPHIWAPPFPPLPIVLKLPLIIAFSKRKMVFSSSTVKAEGSQIGCSQLFGGMILPMQTCGSPMSLPISFPVLNLLHSVSTGMTVGDLVAGFLGIALTMAGDALGGMKKALGPKLDGLAKELLGAGNVKQFALKMAIGFLISCARIAATQEGSLKVEVLSAYTRLEGSIETKRDGKMGFSAEAQSFTGRGTRQDKISHTYAGGGKVIHKVSTSSATMEQAQGATTTDTYGTRGRLEKSETSTWGPAL